MLRALNNYLYIFGDSSVRQIGDITVSGSLTFFTLVILASDIGTTYARTVLSYNRLVLFANKNGVYGIFGASVEKISDDLDGIFGGAFPMASHHSNIDFSLQPSAALNDVRNIHCYLLLVRYVDPVRGARSLILAFQEKQWFLVSQRDALKAITSAQLASTSQVETYGSSGADLTQLLEDPTVAVPCMMQTALSPHQNLIQAKQPIRAGVGLDAKSSVTIKLCIDTENATLCYVLANVSEVIWVNYLPAIVTFVNSTNGAVRWILSGLRFPFADVDGQGKFLGATLTTTIASVAINSIVIEYQDRALFG